MAQLDTINKRMDLQERWKGMKHCNLPANKRAALSLVRWLIWGKKTKTNWIAGRGGDMRWECTGCFEALQGKV